MFGQPNPYEARHQDGSLIPPECNCEECHAYHLMADLFIDQALEQPQDFQCCVDELDLRIRNKEICKKHPRSYFEEFPRYCEGCDEEKEKKKR